MQDHPVSNSPSALEKIIADTAKLGFDMASEPRTGAFLSALAASKPAGKLAEIGTGTGLSAAWLLMGMDSNSQLLSVDNDSAAQQVALKHLGDDPRLSIVCDDGAKWLQNNQDECFDLIFADAWPGKYSHLELALSMLNPGGIYVIDDMLKQPNWPAGHANHVDELLSVLESKKGVVTVQMAWASGLMLVVKTGD
jgi:predicted O-methyltransferase YrrM